MPEQAYATAKRCSVCTAHKPLDQFPKDRSRKDGRMSRCKGCESARAKRRYSQKVQRPVRPYGKRIKRKASTRPRAEHIATCALCTKMFRRPTRETKRFPVCYCSKACAGRARHGGSTTALIGPLLSGPHSRTADAPAARTFIVRQCWCGKWITTCGRQPPATCGTCPKRIWISGPCHECGEQFTAMGQARYCSSTCAKRNGRRRDKQARSKRIQAGVRREAIDLPALAKRDNWHCHICNAEVTRDTWSHDHLIPLSHGGTHTWDNVALAHKDCNARRGARALTQLLLVGHP